MLVFTFKNKKTPKPQLKRSISILPHILLRMLFINVTIAVSSMTAILRHTENLIYCCYIPVLTRFTSFYCARTLMSTPLSMGSFTSRHPRQDITSAKADCRYRAPLSPRLCGILSIISFTILCQVIYKSLKSLLFIRLFKPFHSFFYSCSRAGKVKSLKTCTVFTKYASDIKP